MAVMHPYAQLVGTIKIYLAPYGEAEPNINSVPGANWIEMGETEGEQSIEEAGDLTKFYDNDHQGPVKSVLPQEDIMVNFTLVNMTMEKVARIKRNVAAVVSTTMNGVNVKRMPFKRGPNQTEYALLWRGEADSPYGNLPGQNYFPRGAFNGAGTRTRAKDGRQAVESQFHVFEDDAQTEDYKMGWGTVQY